MKAAIFANGSEKIGMGHIIRTMAIADVLKTKGIEVEYICSNSSRECVEFIESKGYYLKQMFSNEKKYSFIIADSYEIDSEKKLVDFYRFGEKIIYIDDLNMFKNYDIDIIINYAVGAEGLNYYGKAVKLLGSMFTPLRTQFKNKNINPPANKINNVLITMGAADELNYTEYVLKKLLQSYPALNYKVVLGMTNKNKDKIINTFMCPNVEFYINVDDMASLMKDNDAAVSAGGSTIYELCACGIPTIAVITADNQKQFINEISSKIKLQYVDFANGAQTEFTNKFNKLYEDYDYRKKLAYDMKSLIDGEGAERIVDAILR